MTVLVTGAAGFLGRAVVAMLAARAVDFVPTQRSGMTPCDLGQPDDLARLLDALRPTAIVNIAAKADFGPDALARLYPVNTLAPAIMAKYCRQNDAYLIQISGTLVHGQRVERVGAATPLGPDNDYGRSKLLAEQMIEASGALALRLRVGGIFGMAGPDHLGLNRAIRAAANGIKPKIVGEGRALRNYVHVEDLAEIVGFCLDHRPQGVRWLGGPEVLSISGIMHAISEVFLKGAPPERAEGPEAMDQVVETSADLPAGRPMVENLRREKRRRETGAA